MILTCSSCPCLRKLQQSPPASFYIGADMVLVPAGPTPLQVGSTCVISTYIKFLPFVISQLCCVTRLHVCVRPTLSVNRQRTMFLQTLANDERQ